MAEITMDTDWGAKGAQLTGAQVQAFIKEQLRSINLKAESSLGVCKIAYTTIDMRENIYYATIEEYKDMVQNPDEYEDFVTLGVAVLIPGIRPFIVALHESPDVQWSKNMGTLITNSYQDVEQEEKIYADYHSYSAVLSKITELCGAKEDWDKYAVGWCNNYSIWKITPDGGMGLGSGNWKLPSTGHLYAINIYRNAINACLSVIEDSVLLSNNYWSCVSDGTRGIWLTNADSILGILPFNSLSYARPIHIV